MNVVLSPETQKLLEQQMATGRFVDPNDALRVALQSLGEPESQDYEALDAKTRSSIEEAEAQYQRGEGRPWREVRDELRKRFIDNK